MGFTAHVDAHVIIGCFQPINLFHAEKEYSARGPDDKARQMFLSRLQLFESLENRVALRFLVGAMPRQPDYWR